MLLNSVEQDFHDRALALVREFFPPEARPLASLVYGKRTASSLHALSRTLHRRYEKMGTVPAAPVGEDWYDESEEDGGESRIEGVRSTDTKAERQAILGLLGELDSLLDPEMEVSKWVPMINKLPDTPRHHPPKRQTGGGIHRIRRHRKLAGGKVRGGRVHQSSLHRHR